MEETTKKGRRLPLMRDIDLTEGTIWKKLLLFAVPILLTNILQQLFNTVDTAIVGAYESSTALAAVGSVGSLVSLVVGFFMGVSSGSGVIVSRHWGALLSERAKEKPDERALREDERSVNAAVHTAFIVALVMGAIVTLLGMTLSPVLLELINSPDSVRPLSLLYLRIYFAGMIPMMFYNTAAGILRGIGDSNRPLIYLIIAGGSNVILDFIAVAILKWSVAGAAIATLASNLISTVLALIRLMGSKEAYRLRLSDLRVEKNMLIGIIKIGIPTGIQSSMYAISNLLIQSNYNKFGEDAMAGVAAFGTIDGFLYMPINAFGLAEMTFAGQNFGAGKPERVHKAVVSGLAMVMSFDILLAIIVQFISPPLVSSFTQGNAEAIRYAVMMMHILPPTYFIFAPTEILGGVIRGAGSALQTMLLTAFFICVIRVVIVTVFMPFFSDIRLVFAAYPISWLLCSAAFFVYYRFGHWRKEI